MEKSTKDRVAEAIQGSHKSVKRLSDEVGVSRNTIYRWERKETDKFDNEDQLRKLAEATHVDFEWIVGSSGQKSDDPAISEIERRVAEKGESYKGLDQTISDVESKADSLIRDLQVLKNDLSKLRGNGSDG